MEFAVFVYPIMLGLVVSKQLVVFEETAGLGIPRLTCAIIHILAWNL
mgnify:CR=1 FL=1